MSDMKLVKTLFLKAPPEHVWKFLTEKDKLAIWFHNAEEDVRDGGNFTLVSNSLGKEGERIVWGEVIEFDPPRRLVHKFTHNFLNGAETTCEWTLSSVEGGTILRLEHTGWENAKEIAFSQGADHDVGWDEHFARLRKVTS